MMNISFSEACLILAKWRDNKSQLQITFFKPKEDLPSQGSPGIILNCPGKDAIVSALIIIDGQQAEWRVNLEGASFQYGEPVDSAVFPEFAEGKWASYLSVELHTGDLITFAERFIAED
jgi:hypothetical protein